MTPFEMLDLIGRPGGWVHSGVGPLQPPPQPQDLFDFIARSGWRPRRVVVGADLERLDFATARGRCLEPMIYEGDAIYIDRTTVPLPGDIVWFRLSERFAAEQNANPPMFDARPCKAGDPWLKLYAPYGGIGFLFERYGHYMTTTWAACESPDEVPVLHPIVNLRRNGHLLFTPETLCSQIGLGAVTGLNYATDDGTYATGYGGTPISTTYPGSSFAVPYASSPILNFTATESQAVIVTATGTIYFTNTSPATIVSQAYVGVILIDKSSGNSVIAYSPQAGRSRGFNNITFPGTTVSPTPTQQFAFQTEANVTKGHNYAVLLFIQTGLPQVTAETTSVQLQVETIKR